MKPWRLVILLFVCVCACVRAQNKTISSLYTTLQTSQNDSSKTNTYIDLALAFNKNQLPDSAIDYEKKAIKLASAIGFKSGLARAYNLLCLSYVNLDNMGQAQTAYEGAKKQLEKTIVTKKIATEFFNTQNKFGLLCFSEGNNDVALQTFKDGLALAQKTNSAIDIAEFYLNMSAVYSTQGNYSASLKCNFEALKYYGQIKNERGLSLVYNNMGDAYFQQGNEMQAIEYFSNCYVIAKKTKNTSLATIACYNIGDVYLGRKDYTLAKQYAEIGLDLANENKHVLEKSYALLLLGKIFREQKKLDKALAVQLESAELIKDTPEKLQAHEPYSEISKIYFEQNNQKQAILYGEKSLALAQEMKSPLALKKSTEVLYKSYDKIGDFTKAYRVQSIYLSSKDSLLNQSTQKEILNQEYKKQLLADSLKFDANKKINDIKNETQLKNEKTKLIILSIGLLAAIVVGLVLFNRFRITKNQKEIIETQKKSLEIKTKEIQDSILYSKEIQNIFLKSVVNNNTFFKDALLIYKPKDVVSGDFYWYKEINNNTFVVVGDCTGHGVPGAIISVLAIQSLEKIMHQIDDPKELHVLNNLLRKEFDVYYQKENHVSIGLDFSILCINQQEKKLFLSGSGGTILLKTQANNILAESFESINIGGNMPTLYSPRTAAYDFKDLRSVFLYTDGIIDLKGGEKNKKFGTNQLKNLLENLNTKDTPETFLKIENTLEAWRGENQQIDDMTLLGLQINA